MLHPLFDKTLIGFEIILASILDGFLVTTHKFNFGRKTVEFRDEGCWRINITFTEGYPKIIKDIINVKTAVHARDQLVWTKKKWDGNF